MLEGDSDIKCIIITNTTFKVNYFINNTDFFDRVFKGEISVTSDAKPELLEIKRVLIGSTVYNLSFHILGIPVIFLIIGVGVIIVVVIFGFISADKLRRFFKRFK